MKARGCVAHAFLKRFSAALGGEDPHHLQLWDPFCESVSTENRKNGIPKSIQKSILEKYRKSIPKGHQNDPKLTPKTHMFHTFSKKAQMRETIVFTT